jgi:hypothetical protein
MPRAAGKEYATGVARSADRRRTVLVFSLASWVAGGSIITYLSSWLRLPLSSFLLVLALIFSRFFDNHVVAGRTSDSVLPARAPVVDDFHDWQRNFGALPEGPVIVVAAEGGGIRAAYWTAAILSGLQDRNPLKFVRSKMVRRTWTLRAGGSSSSSTDCQLCLGSSLRPAAWEHVPIVSCAL